MPTVTYKHQPGIAATDGHVTAALEKGRTHVYTVGKVLWPEQVESFVQSLFTGSTLHVCSGKSTIGDLRVDLYEEVDIKADCCKLPFRDNSWDSVLCDPPYNGKFQWNHDLLVELSRVARERIIFQHWFMPINPEGRWKKWQEKFFLSAVYLWQPRTYFGRAQVISVLDRDPNFQPENTA